MKSIFDRVQLHQSYENAKSTPTEWVIGINEYDKHMSCYCLTRIVRGKPEPILIKSVPKDSLDEQVRLLSLIFNAKVIKESN